MVAVRDVCSHQRYFEFRVKYLWLILYMVDRSCVALPMAVLCELCQKMEENCRNMQLRR